MPPSKRRRERRGSGSNSRRRRPNRGGRSRDVPKPKGKSQQLRRASHDPGSDSSSTSGDENCGDWAPPLSNFTKSLLVYININVKHVDIFFLDL